jgi:L-arabinose isomerase
VLNLKSYEVWFITGSQHLYGPDTLKQVAANSQQIANALNGSPVVPIRVVFKPVAKTPQEVTELCQRANTAADCIGLITWCHTFSPSKMWINGLKLLQKPIVHLHTQHNRQIPWAEIDMDFMNLNQAAHGDREHGFIMSRMRLNRKVVVGFWQDQTIQQQLGAWCRAAAAWHDWQGAKFCRFGDNMREVAVTEGNKVAAQIQFGYSVNGYGIGDLVKSVEEVSESELDKLVREYKASFRLLVNEVEVVATPKPLPKLPVARAIWAPQPKLEVAAAAWIYAGGAHHTGFSQAVTTEVLEDFAAIADIEIAIIDAKTNVREFQQQLHFNEVYYALKRGWTM